LATKSGFELTETIFDSSEIQFAGSELYVKGIPLNVDNKLIDVSNIFTAEQRVGWRQEAEELNKTGQGDQAIFYLKKVKQL
jgi:hypothetical protein